MLLRLSEKIAECYHMAEGCEKLALESGDKNKRNGYMILARNWRILAESIQFSERISSFVTNIK